MAPLDVELSRVDLDPSRPLRRDRPRPPELREPDYDDAFDFFTVFYDCFRSVDGRSIVFVGPPLYNLAESVLPVLEESLGRSWFLRLRHRPLDRVSEVWARSRAERIALPGGAFVQDTVSVQPNCAEMFRGTRALVVVSKDNELAWIRDWATFHVRNHGCNAILFYDNDSTRYELSELRALFASIKGIEVACVIPWAYKHGVPGRSDELWDSDFSQYGMLAHARRRFLARAAAVLNADIDELVMTHDGSSIYDLARESRRGYLRYRGVWIENAADVPPERRRHAHFRYRKPGRGDRVDPKWCVVPARCPFEAQWLIHNVSAMKADKIRSANVSYRHFRAININWREQRYKPEAPSRDLVVDEELAPWMQVFEDVAGPAAGG